MERKEQHENEGDMVSMGIRWVALRLVVVAGAAAVLLLIIRYVWF